MEVGEHCTLESCHRLTFLPISCAYCRSFFCQSHFLPLQHRCSAPGAAEADRTLSDTEILKRVQRANARRVEIQRGEEATTSSSALGSVEGGPSRLPCQKVNCKRFSLQLDQPSVTPAKSPLGVSLNDGRHDWRPAVTHAAPRCDRCRGFFCVGWVKSGSKGKKRRSFCAYHHDLPLPGIALRSPMDVRPLHLQR